MGDKMRALVFCIAIAVAWAAPLEPTATQLDDQVAANARFAQTAVKAIRSVQSDLENMKTTEQAEVGEMSQIGNDVKKVPDHQPGQFAAEEQVVVNEAAKIEKRAAAAVKNEDTQQKLALDALSRANTLISSFNTAGVSKKKAKKKDLGSAGAPGKKTFGVQETRLGETGTPEQVKQQYAAAKQALSKLKEVSATLTQDTKTSNTKALIEQMKSEASSLEEEASAPPTLGENHQSALERTLDADEAKLKNDAASANFKSALATVNAASQAVLAKSEPPAAPAAPAAAAPAAPAANEHSQVLRQETKQLTELLQQEKQVTKNEKADEREVQSLWDKLN